MQIVIDKSNKTPMYKQIAFQIENSICSGELPNGYILPPERKLSQQLGVNRTTVLNAYRYLKAEGYLDSRVGQGTMVQYEKNSGGQLNKEILPMYYEHLYASKGRHLMSEFEKNLLKSVGDMDTIQFGVGIQNIQEDVLIEESMSAMANNKGIMALAHTPYTGLVVLKDVLRNHLAPYQIRCTNQEMMITSGSQQGIGLIAELFINPGDVVIVEDPSYFFAVQAFESKGAKIISVPIKEDGMDIQYLKQVLKTTNVKMIYTMPNYQNPTNCSMTTEKKSKLLELAYRHQVVILEDGAYNDLAFDGLKPITLKSMDYNGQVIYIGTFSKVVAMGLRLGFMIAPDEIIERCAYIKHLTDIHTASMSQWLVYDLLVKGYIDKIIQQLTLNNRYKLDAFIKTYEQVFSSTKDITFVVPDGGIYIWLEFPRHTDCSKLLSYGAKEGVTFVPGRLFSYGANYNHCLRLNYVFESPTRIEIGLKRLKIAYDKYVMQHERGKVIQADMMAIL